MELRAVEWWSGGGLSPVVRRGVVLDRCPVVSLSKSGLPHLPFAKEPRNALVA